MDRTLIQPAALADIANDTKVAIPPLIIYLIGQQLICKTILVQAKNEPCNCRLDREKTQILRSN